MPRIAIGSLIQESNTFSPVLTRYADLAPVFGDGVVARHRGNLTEVGGFLTVLEKAKAEAVPLGAAWAVTAGRVVRNDLDRLVDQMLAGLRKAGKVDGVLLALHGAQTAEGIDDVEGYVLGKVRAQIGPEVPLFVTLDLHANVTQAMIDAATAIAGYRTYPHIDMYETGMRAAKLLLQTIAGKVKPVMRWVKLPLILPAENQLTTSGPMARLRRRADEMEAKAGMLVISLFPVQPWLDIEEMGVSVVAVADKNADLALRCAEKLGRRLWKTREQYRPKLYSVAEALEIARAEQEGPVVLSESSDSTGSGSPGDSTGLLKHLLTADLPGPAAIFLVDPPGVEKAFAAGVGKRISLRLGGHYDREHSQPVAVKGYIRLLSDGRWTARARGYNTGIETCMGRTAVVEAGLVRILMAERAAMTVDPELFRSHGIDPAHCRIAVVKSPGGFRAAYAPIAKKMLVVDTPGLSTANLGQLPWKHLKRPIWPLDEM